MLFKELNKLLDNLVRFIYGISAIDKNGITEREREYILSQLRKAGIEIKE